MKPRIFKKLCKESARILGTKNCEVEDGIWFFCWIEYGVDCIEYDSVEAWTWIVKLFDAEVNTILDPDSPCGISWKSENQAVKSTPKNVFKWARKNFKSIQSN